jgi:predicted nucleic acid-binding protein
MLAYPEGRAALAAARRGGRLDKRGHAHALADFEDLVPDLALVGVDEPLARRAGELAEELELRGYDAVHLATALALGEDKVTLVTWDEDLAKAALEAGLAVAPVPPSPSA